MTELHTPPGNEPGITHKEDNERVSIVESTDPPPGRNCVTYTIIMLNVLVFLLMVLSGVHFFKPNSLDILKWGANFPVLVFDNEWWRLITSVFIHIGIIHLVVNMYSLYFIGSVLEPLLGRPRYIIAYLCTGIAASLTSVTWYKEDMVISAGASGALFGLYGVLLSLLTTGVVPKSLRLWLLQSVLIGVAYNIFYGLRPGSGTDNAAHLGGFATGMIVGYIYYLTFRKPSPQKTRVVTASLSLAMPAIVFFVWQSGQVPATVVDYKTGAIFNPAEKKQEEGIEKFSRSYEHFLILEEIALEAMQQPDSISTEEFLIRLKRTALADWVECVNLMDEAAALTLPRYQQLLRTDLRQYAGYRIQEVQLIIKAEEENTHQYDNDIDALKDQIDEILKKINEENEPLGEPKPRSL